MNSSYGSIFRYQLEMKSRILYYPGLLAQCQARNLKMVIISALILAICTFDNVCGQSVWNGSYVGLESNHYSSHLQHITVKWYHLTRLTIKDDTVWVEQDPITIHKRDTIWSSSDGGFYYFEGGITTNGSQITMHLKMTNCDYCGVPIDSVYHEQWSHPTWSGQMTNNGMLINGSLYSRSNQEAHRWPLNTQN